MQEITIEVKLVGYSKGFKGRDGFVDYPLLQIRTEEGRVVELLASKNMMELVEAHLNDKKTSIVCSLEAVKGRIGLRATAFV